MAERIASSALTEKQKTLLIVQFEEHQMVVSARKRLKVADAMGQSGWGGSDGLNGTPHRQA
jgi:hypothetical protein